MNNGIILFDWDDTLFSKKEYKKNLRANLARVCETSEEDIFELEEHYFNNLAKSDDFRIDDFINSFEQKFNKNIYLEDFSTDKLGIYSKSLFPETINSLTKINDKYSMGIYSQGFESLQKIKIKYSGIEHFFDPNLIFINRDKTQVSFINQLPAQVIVIDDKKEVIETLKQLRSDLNLIWLNRNDNEILDEVKTIKNLGDLI